MKSNRKKLCLLKLFSSRPRSPCCLSLLSVCLSGLTAELLRGSAHPAQAGAACKMLHYFRITPRLGERHAEFRLLLRGQLLSLALVSTAGAPSCCSLPAPFGRGLLAQISQLRRAGGQRGCVPGRKRRTMQPRRLAPSHGCPLCALNQLRLRLPAAPGICCPASRCS